MDGPIIDFHVCCLRVGPSQSVLHPAVEALGEILPKVGSAALLPVQGARDRYGRLRDEIGKLERLDKLRVPYQGAVGYSNVVTGAPDVGDLLHAFLQNRSSAVHVAIVLHDLLHLEAQLGSRRAASGVTNAVEPRQRKVGSPFWQFRLCVTGRDCLRTPEGCSTSKDDEVDQGV